MLEKKQIQMIFLFKFKTCHKAAEITCNISNAFGPGAANEHTVQRWFKMFSKGDENLEDEECNGQPSEVDNDQLRVIIKADPFTTTQEVAEEFNIEHSTVLCHLKELERWKSSISGCLMNDPQIKKIVILKCCLLLLYATRNHFLCKVDFIWQLVMTSSVAGQRKSSKALPKAKLAPKKKVMISVGGRLPVWSTTASWIPAKSLHLRSMLGKLMRCTENCNVYSLCYLTERARCLSTTMSECTLHNQCFRSWTNFASTAIFIRPLTKWWPLTSSSISTTSCREKASTTSRRQKMLSKSSSNPEAWIFTLQE